MATHLYPSVIICVPTFAFRRLTPMKMVTVYQSMVHETNYAVNGFKESSMCKEIFLCFTSESFNVILSVLSMAEPII